MIFRFGSYELDEDAGELRRKGAPVPIQPKPLQLLRLLIRDRARVVPSAEIFAALWPGTAVTPGSLTRAVSHARRAIGDTHRGATLRSFPRRGYRFCAEVVEVGAAAGVDERDGATPARSETGDGLGPFVGREGPLARLHDAFRRVEAGRGAVALVTGPAGIGKTRLVEVFADEMRRRGPAVAIGRCREGEGVPAFWLWAQIVRRLLDDDAFADAVRGLAAHSSELAGLVPGLHGPDEDEAPARDLSPEQRRFLFFDAVAGVLSRCSRRRPLLLVLEDLQWAGSPSLRLLEHLAFELAECPVLIVATIREAPRGRGDPLERTLSILHQQAWCTPIGVESFSRAEVGALLARAIGRTAPSELTSEVFARTEGVPLFVREAIRLLEERGDLRRPELAARRGIALPTARLDLIRRALGALDEASARLVGAASVVGRTFSVPLVAGVAEVSREEALDRLDVAAAAGVVERHPQDATRFRFSHALFQEAACEALPPGARARLHDRAATQLERQHEGHPEQVIAEVAHHRHQGIAVGDPVRAYECALAAAERASALCAYEQVAVHYEQAVAAIDHFTSVDAELRLRTLLILGEAYRLAGDRERRRAVLRQAMASAHSLGRPREFALAAIGFCDLSEWGVRDEPARAAIEVGLQGLGEDGVVERARLATRLAYLSAFSRERAEPLARSAVALCREVGDADALQEALYTLHLILAGPNDLDERRDLWEEMEALSTVSHFRDAVLIAAIDVACDRLTLGDGDGAARMRAEAGRVSGDVPHPGLVWHMQVYDTGLALMQGRLDEVAALCERALSVGQRIGHPYARGCHRAHQVGLARERGDPETVMRLLDRGLDASEGAVHWMRAVWARAAHACGRKERAREIFEELAARDFADVPMGLRWTDSMVEVAHLCADLGDGDRAPLLVERMARFEHHHGVLPVPVCYGGPVTHCLARLVDLRGRSGEAAELYEDAREAAAALGARPTEARILAEWGGLLERSGQRSRARTLREEAESLARACTGATGDSPVARGRGDGSN